MTDDEIDAALIPKLAKHIGMVEADVRILPFDRLAYRAGMREAARIALGGLLLTTEREWCLGYNAAINAISAAIERAAGGEG